MSKEGKRQQHKEEKEEDDEDAASSVSSDALELTVDEDGRLAYPGPPLNYDTRTFPKAFDLTTYVPPYTPTHPPAYLPTYSFTLRDASLLPTLISDCRLAATARAQAREGGEYSEGETFFLKANEEPTTRYEWVGGWVDG